MSLEQDTINYLAMPDGASLAYRLQPGCRPGVLFLPGFRSDMSGTKAEVLAQWCSEQQRAYLRFDYRGHGRSGGEFRECSIGTWLEDTLAIVDRVAEGPLVLVGSSMGGWLALLAARARPGRVAGLLGIAAAPDFTDRLYRERLDDAQRAALEREGECKMPSDYDDGPYIISSHLIEEARQHQLLTDPLILDCPVRLIQGQLDDAVPWTSAVTLLNHLQSPDAELQLVKHGDHRLSAPGDLQRMRITLEALLDNLPRAAT